MESPTCQKIYNILLIYIYSLICKIPINISSMHIHLPICSIKHFQCWGTNYVVICYNCFNSSKIFLVLSITKNNKTEYFRYICLSFNYFDGFLVIMRSYKFMEEFILWNLLAHLPKRIFMLTYGNEIADIRLDRLSSRDGWWNTVTSSQW